MALFAIGFCYIISRSRIAVLPLRLPYSAYCSQRHVQPIALGGTTAVENQTRRGLFDGDITKRCASWNNYLVGLSCPPFLDGGLAFLLQRSDRWKPLRVRFVCRLSYRSHLALTPSTVGGLSPTSLRRPHRHFVSGVSCVAGKGRMGQPD